MDICLYCGHVTPSHLCFSVFTTATFCFTSFFCMLILFPYVFFVMQVNPPSTVSPSLGELVGLKQLLVEVSELKYIFEGQVQFTSEEGE